MSIVNILMN